MLELRVVRRGAIAAALLTAPLAVGCGGDDDPAALAPFVPADFTLEDVNPTSTSFGQPVSPRAFMEQATGWYFTRAF